MIVIGTSNNELSNSLDEPMNQYGLFGESLYSVPPFPFGSPSVFFQDRNGVTEQSILYPPSTNIFA